MHGRVCAGNIFVGMLGICILRVGIIKYMCLIISCDGILYIYGFIEFVAHILYWGLVHGCMSK